MSVPFHLLILEDNLSDAELMVEMLLASGFDPTWKRVDNELDYLAALSPCLDLIL